MLSWDRFGETFVEKLHPALRAVEDSLPVVQLDDAEIERLGRGLVVRSATSLPAGIEVDAELTVIDARGELAAIAAVGSDSAAAEDQLLCAE